MVKRCFRAASVLPRALRKQNLCERGARCKGRLRGKFSAASLASVRDSVARKLPLHMFAKGMHKITVFADLVS